MARLLRRLRGWRVAFLVVVLSGVGVVGAPSATAVTVSQSTPASYSGTNTCTGEPFAGTGMMHFLTTDSVSTSGAVNFDLDVRFDGLQAVTATGKRYVVQDVFFWRFTFAGAAEETFDLIAHFVRVGEDGSFVIGDDFYEYLRTHITANANGLVTSVSVNTSDQPCQ